MTDPVGDLFTRIRNSLRARKNECLVPHSKLKAALAGILVREGYIASVADGADAQGHKALLLQMKYVDGTPAITGLRRMSTPGRRLYYPAAEIPRVLNGLGISILTTSKGVLTDADCRRQKVGGELICNVW